MLALVAFAAQVAEPDYSDYREVVSEQVEHFRYVHQIQQRCEALLTQYTTVSRRNRNYLQRTAWDQPGGWVDPSAINAARYRFINISVRFRNEIDRIQRSAYPQYSECKFAYQTALSEHQSLLRSLLYNGR